MSPIRGMLLVACLTLAISSNLCGLPPLTLETGGLAGPSAALQEANDPLPAGAVGRLGSAKFRGGGQVILLAFAPSGQLLASGNNYGVVSVWETATGREVRQFKGRPWGNNWFAFANQGKSLALMGEDMTIQTWDLATGKMLRHFAGPPNGVSNLAFAPNGEIVCLVGDDMSVRVWELATGKELIMLVPGQFHERAHLGSPHGPGIAALAEPAKHGVPGRGLRARRQDAGLSRWRPNHALPRNRHG